MALHHLVFLDRFDRSEIDYRACQSCNCEAVSPAASALIGKHNPPKIHGCSATGGAAPTYSSR